MIALLQRVSCAQVTVNNKNIADINAGLLVFLGMEQDDSERQAQQLLHKVLNYRLFEDKQGKMNLSISETDGDLLLVPQFTLAANTQKGLRPSFTSAASPEAAKPLFDYFVKEASSLHSTVKTGKFGADMKVQLVNDGPVTFWLQT